MHIPCCSRSAVSSSCESWIICSLGISFGSAVYTEDSKQAICKNASYNLWPSFIRALSKYCITFCRSPSSSCVLGKAAANASSAEKTIKNLIGIWNEMILSVSFVSQAVLSQNYRTSCSWTNRVSHIPCMHGQSQTAMTQGLGCALYIPYILHCKSSASHNCCVPPFSDLRLAIQEL